MRLEELEELVEENPSEAEAAIAELVSTSSVGELAEIAKSTRAQRLAGSAMEGLADVGGPEATGALVELLEQASTPFLIGGTEQQLDHQRRQDRLVRAVARARNVPPPAGRSPEDIEEFIEESRRS